MLSKVLGLPDDAALMVFGVVVVDKRIGADVVVLEKIGG